MSAPRAWKYHDKSWPLMRNVPRLKALKIDNPTNMTEDRTKIMVAINFILSLRSITPFPIV